MSPREHVQRHEQRQQPASARPSKSPAPAEAMEGGHAHAPAANLNAQPPGLATGTVLRLQRVIGNRATGQMLDAPRQTPVVAGAGAATLTIQRDDTTTTTAPVVTQFDTWDECYKAMDAVAQKGHDQFVALFGDAKAVPVRNGACKDRATSKFDKVKADAIWSKKAMADDKFAEEMAKKEQADVNSIQGRLTQIEHLCDETDGTNRPGSVGDGTSDWALKWEAEHGEPFRSPAGHAYKLRDYCKVIKEGLAEIQAKQGSVKDDPTKDRISKVIVRATDRYAKMAAALAIWNDRATLYPTVWNSDGTTKVAPPGSDPLARGQLQPGWPKEATLAIP